MINFEILD